MQRITTPRLERAIAALREAEARVGVSGKDRARSIPLDGGGRKAPGTVSTPGDRLRLEVEGSAGARIEKEG